MALARINLNELPNNGCRTNCSKPERLEITENDVCGEVSSVNDNLPIRCVGKWAVEKIYLLYQYFGIFTIGMKNKWKINYIEICSGPGRCVSRDSGTEFDGTSLSVLKHPAFPHIHKALFFDVDSNIVDTLNRRILALNIPNAKAIVGDYSQPEELCHKVYSEINPRSLTLVFIDPTDCSVPFNLLRHLKKTIPNIDFIINVAIRSDVNRNIKEVLLQPEKYRNTIFKYSRFLGTTNFFKNRQNLKFAEEGNNQGLRNAFRDTYELSLRNIGYNHFRFNPIDRFYDILFATSNPRGIEFWDKATKIKFNGQGTLNL